MSLRKSITEKFNKNDETVTQELHKYYFRSSVILASISFVLLVLSIIFFGNINQMSFISPYFVIVTSVVNLIIAGIILLLYLKKCNSISMDSNKAIIRSHPTLTSAAKTHQKERHCEHLETLRMTLAMA